jgi:Tfp pilus assembly protein PilF
VLVLTVLAFTAFGQTRNEFQRATPSSTKSDVVQAAAKKDGYVGSQACGDCHSEIYSEYMRTGMGRSMSSVSPAFLQNLHLPAVYTNQRLDRYYDVIARKGKLYESEYALDGTGREIFRDEHQLAWIIGSGANGIGAIVQRGNYLFEAPLTLYTRTMTWEMSPGYESTDMGFSRPILPGCLFCHSGRSNPITGSDGRFESAVFSEMPIGCENCHGPGAAHIDAVTSGGTGKGGSSRIVNPARLTPDLANNICMACHEIGNERILKPGKEYKDVRPGEPLDNVLSILMTPPTREAPPDKDHLQHYYSMTLSKCYRASGGRLRCITCHDPHLEPAKEEAPTFFNKRCMSCHTDESCKLPRKARQQSSPSDNCIGCHMPKRENFVAHSTLTNHRITAQANEPFPESTFSQTTAALPDLVHLNPPPGKQDVAPPLLTLLQVYGELAAHRPEYAAPYYRVLDQLQRTESNDTLVQAALGRRCLQSGNLQEAIQHLKQSLAIGKPPSAVYSDLSEALDKLGQREQGLAMLQKAIQEDPFNPLLQRSLVFRLIDLKQYANARAAMSRYSQVFPQDFFMRQKFAAAMESVSAQ